MRRTCGVGNAAARRRGQSRPARSNKRKTCATIPLLVFARARELSRIPRYLVPDRDRHGCDRDRTNLSHGAGEGRHYSCHTSGGGSVVLVDEAAEPVAAADLARRRSFEYRASTAQWHADRRGRRPKAAKLASNTKLHRYVQDRLSGAVERPDGVAVDGPKVEWIGRRHGRRKDRRWARSWSPEQISARLRLDFPDDESMRISHEAISQSLYVQGRGALRRELTACLRSGRALRVPRARSRRGKSFVSEEILISARPAEAADRAVPGHWEGDLILGLGSSAIGTLVERSTRFTLLLHLPPMHGDGSTRVKNGPALAGHGAEAVRNAIADTVKTLPEQRRRPRRRRVKGAIIRVAAHAAAR